LNVSRFGALKEKEIARNHCERGREKTGALCNWIEKSSFKEEDRVKKIFRRKNRGR